MDHLTEPQPPAPPPARDTRSSKIAGALIGAVAALSLGGVGFAFAQEATDPPATQAPAAETPAAPSDHAREDCPDKDGAPAPDAAAADNATDV